MTSNKNRDWKDKYIQLLGDFENKQSQKQEYIALLQRALIRSILAAEGQDPKLDKSLKELRSAVRKELETNRLEQLIDEFEHQLVAADKHSESQQKATHQALIELSNQLLLQKPSAQLKKSLNQYQADLPTALQHSHNLHLLLHELSTLQAAILNTASTAVEPEKRSFFQRLLPGNTNNNEPHGEATDNQEKAEPATQSSDNAALIDDTQLHALFEHIQSILLQLIADLPVNHHYQALASALNEKLRAGVNCFDLTEILEELAALVIAIHSTSHQEIEEYLQQLNQKLNTVNTNLQATQSNYQVTVSAADSFDTQMHGQVHDLSQDVQSSANLDDLKQRVDQRINQFVNSLEQYKEQRKEAENNVTERFNSLQQRIASMETETQKLYSKLEEQHQKSRLDPLTGIANRAAWDERLQLEHARLSRTTEPLLLAIIDIDHFKRINDNYGHIAGDKVLKIIANKISNTIRSTDFIARYGGEEFVILLPNTQLDSGEVLLNKIREKIAATPFHFKGEPVQITFSAGIGQLHSDEPTTQAFTRIDEAMYQAKSLGRNTVTLSKP